MFDPRKVTVPHAKVINTFGAGDNGVLKVQFISHCSQGTDSLLPAVNSLLESSSLGPLKTEDLKFFNILSVTPDGWVYRYAIFYDTDLPKWALVEGTPGFFDALSYAGEAV